MSPGADTIRLLAVGDMFLADSPAKLGLGVRSSIRRKGIGHFVDRVGAFTGGFDLCFCNLENVLSSIGYSKYNLSTVEMRGEPDFVRILKEPGFNVVNVANNHIFQHGLDAYCDTVQMILDAGIKVIGDVTLADNFQVLLCKDVQVGFVGYSLHYEQYRPKERPPYALRSKYDEILAEVKGIRTAFNGTLICSLHWGHEHVPRVSAQQRDFCHELVDHGVDVVLGHHPHVAQGIEAYRGAVIAYSLGNFIFDMDSPETKETFALALTIDADGGLAYEVVPVSIGDDYCPYPMAGTEGERFLAKMDEMSVLIQTGSCQSDEELVRSEKRACSAVAKISYVNFARNLYRLNPYYSLSLIVRTMLRRTGVLHNP